MMEVDESYVDLINCILNNGTSVNARNSMTRRSTVMPYTFDSTPLVSIRRTAWKKALYEMEWFLSGSSNINDLHPSVHPWWTPWASDGGIIRNNYGKQFRYYNSTTTHQIGKDGVNRPSYEFDQIEFLAEGIKTNPFSRRNVITAWNTAEMADTATPLTNCHGTVIQAFCQGDELELCMYQRSADVLLGVPHNWIQYWALLLWLAKKCDKTPSRFSWIGGDCHIYENHIDLAIKIRDEYKTADISTPELVYSGDGGKFKADDFGLVGEYKPVLTDSAKMIV